MRLTLKQARQLAGMTIKEAAVDLKVTPTTISCWETGKAEPRARTFMKACNLYNVNAYDIFFDSELEKEGKSEGAR